MVNSSRDVWDWRGDTPRSLPRLRGLRLMRVTSSLVAGTLNSSGGNSGKVGRPIHADSTRVVLMVSIKLLIKIEEHTLQLLMSIIQLLHLPMTG